MEFQIFKVNELCVILNTNQRLRQNFNRQILLTSLNHIDWLELGRIHNLPMQISTLVVVVVGREGLLLKQ